MTKITTDFVGTENIAVTKQRLTDILAYWGASTAAYTTWGQARTALNALLTSTTAGTIGSTELAGSFLPKINFLNDPDDMIADALFGAGEQGVWLDPSDVANVAWRRNLLLQTEDFTSAAWSRDSQGVGTPTVTANFGTAPDGTNTADRLQMNKTGGTYTRISQVGPISSPTYTGSVWMKNNGAGTANVGLRLISTAINCEVTGTWQRFSVTVSGATLPPDLQIMLFDSIPGNDETADVLVWGAQLELGTVATDYQRITDLNTEVIERFPNATMYQDAAGTTAVYAPGQPVGLRLDKSKGAPVLGAEKVVNGDFTSGTTGWVAQGDETLSVSSGRLRVTMGPDGGGGGNTGAMQTITGFVVGRTYRLTLGERLAGTNGAVGVSIRPAPIGSSANAAVFYSFSSASNEAVLFTAPATTLYLFAYAGYGTAGTYVEVDNISVREFYPGNHATQSTAGSRPMYGIEPKGGRRNLLTWTEQVDNAVWTKEGVSITANATVAPDGATTADKMVEAATTGRHLAATSSFTFGGGVNYTFTIKVKAAERQYIQISSPSTATTSFANFDVSAGTKTAGTTGFGSIVPDLNGFYLITVTFAAGGGSGDIGVDIITNPTAGRGAGGYTGNGTSGLFIWGAQLEAGTAPTNYQRVTTAFDVTEAGVNSCHYCQYDGSDDGMVTNSIDFTATDKMSVFAGVRRSAITTNYQCFLELSASSDSNNGVFAVFSESFSAGARMYFQSKGTVTVPAYPSAGVFPDVTTNAVTGLGDISGDTATLRKDGVQVAQATTDQGPGNYGNHSLYLGRRGGAVLPFNGRDYGILITGKLANATAIATTEMWLANKTPGVNL